MSDRAFFGAPRRAPHLVRRERLEARLDDAAMITTIDAGAGFGKTALLALWVSSRSLPGFWVDASTAAGDRVSFWHNVFAIAAEASSHPGNEVLREAVLPGPGALADADVAHAVAAFARSLPSAVMVVVDNAHLLDLEAIGADLVTFSRFATGSRLVVADRRRRFRPGLFASDVEEERLSGDDLRLDERETAAVIDASRAGRSRGRLDSHEVFDLTNGIVGLTRRVMAGGAGRPGRGDDADLLVPWASAVRRSPAFEDRTDTTDAPANEGTSAALPVAHLVAILGSATREEVGLLCGLHPEAAFAVLETAADHGLGGWIDGDTDGSFAFAPVVTRTAAAVVAGTVPAPEQRRIAARLAHVFAVRGDALAAFGLAIDAGDFDLAVAIGKRSFLEMVKEDTPGLLRRLRRVPLTRLRRYPLLVLFIAMLHAQSPRGRAAALVHFGLAEQLARTAQSTAAPDDRAVMAGVRSAAMRLQGAFDKATPVAHEFLDRFDALTLEEQDRSSSLSRHLLWQAAHTLLFAGETEAAIGAAQRMLAVPVPADLVEDRGIRPALALVAAVQATTGSMLEARQTLEEAVRHPRRDSPFYAVWERSVEALSAIELGEFERARVLVESLEHPIGAGEYWPVDVVVRALAEVGDGRVDAAVRVIESVLEIESPPRQGTATRDVVVVLHALLAAAGRPAGEAAGVLRHVSRADALSALGEAVIALRGGVPVTAVRLTGAQQLGRSSAPRVRASILLVRAAACAAMSQGDAAAAAGREALAVMAESGLATPWMLLTSAERATLLDLVGPETVGAALRESLGRMPVVFQGRAMVERLTTRERDVLAHLVSGATVPQVAAAAGVSTNTVKTQRTRIYRKLGVDNRADAARVALEHDLL